MQPIERDLHRVSTKALIYTPDKTKALLMHMFPNSDKETYALPGGHVDAGEVPDETIVRELQEELGVIVPGLTHLDFFVHINGKIVLAYLGTFTEGAEFVSLEPEKEIGRWMTRAEVEAIQNIEPTYKKMILEHWDD